MKRLTERDGDKWAFVACRDCTKPHCTKCEEFRKQAATLAGYENLKLTSEEAKSLLRDAGIGIAMHNRELQAEISRLKNWVNDLQSGMYVNCVYCGHRYGQTDEVSVSMADVLKAHIEQCPDHPMSKLKQEIERLKAAEPREEVKWFAEEMEKVLQANDHKGGWDKCDDGYLAWMLRDNLGKLCEAAYQEPKNLQEISKSAVDIANYAMMIADNVRKIGGKENEV